MPVDAGRLNINTAGARETFASDLASGKAIRGTSVVDAIMFRAPKANTGNVFVGLVTVSSTYGWTLGPGDAVPLNSIREVFSAFYGDAVTSGDDIEWWASFQASATGK